MSEGIGTVTMPEKLVPMFEAPRGEYQYRGSYGGRGSGKSFNFAKMAAVWGYMDPMRILATREYMGSIKESFYAELKSAILSETWLAKNYIIGTDFIKGRNGTEFIFMGLRRSINSIRSLAQIDLTIVEEAEDVPENSWLMLEATVFRRPKSELWPIWNPRTQGSPVDLRFRKDPPAGCPIIEMNYSDNPFFPPALEVLRAREEKRLDPDTYAHVWEGQYLTNSHAQVYHGKWKIAEFEPGLDWDGPYQGGDFGFSQDPLAAVRVWIHNEMLFVEYEAGAISQDLDDTPSFLDFNIPGWASFTSRWDNARPESISHFQKHGMERAEAADKWPGSVEDGIQFIRSFRMIIIHPRCPNTIREAKLYSYKVDRYTGDILPTLIDANNHYWDAIRYALSPIIKHPMMVQMFVSSRHKFAANNSRYLEHRR
jgi:phage terminase large subunit